MHLAAEVVDEEDAVVGLHLHGRRENAAGFVVVQFEHAGYQLAAHHDEGSLARHPARIELGVFFIDGLMHYGIVEHDDLAVYFHGVRDQNRIAVHAQQPLGETGFAVAGRAIKKQRFLRNDGGPELIEHAVGKHQVAQRVAQHVAVDVDHGGLRLGGQVVIADGNRSRPDVAADAETLRGQVAPRVGQRKSVVFADRAFHFHQVLLSQFAEETVQNRDGDFECAAGDLEAADAVEVQVPQNEIHDHGFGNPQIGETHGNGRPERGAPRRCSLLGSAVRGELLDQWKNSAIRLTSICKN